jgi:hypothetical protein
MVYLIGIILLLLLLSYIIITIITTIRGMINLLRMVYRAIRQTLNTDSRVWQMYLKHQR